jgi:hypothetical protein
VTRADRSYRAYLLVHDLTAVECDYVALAAVTAMRTAGLRAELTRRREARALREDYLRWQSRRDDNGVCRMCGAFDCGRIGYSCKSSADRLPAERVRAIQAGAR